MFTFSGPISERTPVSDMLWRSTSCRMQISSSRGCSRWNSFFSHSLMAGRISGMSSRFRTSSSVRSIIGASIFSMVSISPHFHSSKTFNTTSCTMRPDRMDASGTVSHLSDAAISRDTSPLWK